MDYFEEVQEGRWKPQNGDEYYYIDDMWDIVDVVRHNNDVDVFWYRYWNCFQTEKQAKAYKYLVEHEQRLADNWDKYISYYIYRTSTEPMVLWWRVYDKHNISPSKRIVPSTRTQNQQSKHLHNLKLVYPYLFK